MEVPIILTSLGTMYYAQGKYEEALKMHSELSRKDESCKIVAEKWYQLGMMYQNRGKLYDTTNRKWGTNHRMYVKATNAYEKALKFYFENFVENGQHLCIAVTLDGLGYVQKTQENFEISLLMFKKSLDMYSSLLGPNLSDIRTVNVLIYIGEVYENIGEYQQAILKYSESLQLCRSIFGEYAHTVTVRVLERIPSISVLEGSYDDTISKYKDSLQMKYEIFRDNTERAEFAR